MPVAVKICGLSTPETVRVAAEAGAAYVGFVFFPPSPRHISTEQAAALAAGVPGRMRKVGVFVDPTDALLDETIARVDLDILQLHGQETPARVRDIRARYGRDVMKAIAVAEPADIETAKSYESVSDLLLFDAKAPKTLENALPGGNGLVFDWQLIRQENWSRPWMLSGGLDSDNVAEAITTSGAKIVDVSSGVESRPGQKDVGKIQDFIRAAHTTR
ncbi:phosphoribosylanthranilate isomerase [Luteithermobacter gelatinilyticus]|uniref:phosphoribosylanthranilate isomerase n=1 Tax=Luteithermobacter gelatinilyticus TaxID=2582913 RepID=UPI001106092F|nr:phosphoribosylanthranilate isomerase [Luteithermobacter gelatinilyticus]